MRGMRRWEHLTWPEIADARARGVVAVIPAGAVEQHGPHLPVGTDVLIPVGLADRLADAGVEEELGFPFVMLPPLSHTYARHSNWWPGTLNLDGETLLGYTRALLDDLFRQGVTRALILNGHLESVPFIMEGVELACGRVPTARVLLVNWWELVSDALIRDLFGDAWPGWEAEHAALTETSLMLAFYPELVRRERITDDRAPRTLPYRVFPQPEMVRPPSGVYANAAGASAEIGERLAAHIVTGLTGALREWFGATASHPA
ncbi:MAG: creatininase family protein [Armatimonadota bacterium]|nr:creatininase family protein [Armatimonadota bacterium]